MGDTDPGRLKPGIVAAWPFSKEFTDPYLRGRDLTFREAVCLFIYLAVCVFHDGVRSRTLCYCSLVHGTFNMLLSEFPDIL